MLRNFLFLSTVIIAGSFFYSAEASEQRFIIIEADGRSFLLDTKEGSTWRYYFNNIENQGWTRNEFSYGTHENTRYYSDTPYGEILTEKIQQKKQ